LGPNQIAEEIHMNRHFWNALLVIGTAAAAVAAPPAGGGTSIHQEVDFYSSPIGSANAAILYEALLDEKEVGAFSGAPARIDPAAGGAFKLYGGRVTGRNVELVPNRRIVQAWRVETWPAGVYSIVRIELTETDAGVRLVLDQTGFPPEARDALSANWPKKYWDPLRKHLYLTLP